MPTEKNIKTPEILYELFEEYKVDCKKTPKYENQWSNRLEKVIQVPREIPMTWEGFSIFVRHEGIINHLEDYRFNSNGAYEAYSGIIRVIDSEIYKDKFDGATAGIFQHNIIARDLGLVDNKQIDRNTSYNSDKPKVIKIVKVTEKEFKDKNDNTEDSIED